MAENSGTDLYKGELILLLDTWMLKREETIKLRMTFKFLTS